MQNSRDGRKLYCKKCGNEFTNMEKVLHAMILTQKRSRRKTTDEDKFKKMGQTLNVNTVDLLILTG